MTSRTDRAQRNRDLMPNVAVVVDRFRAVFPDLKVRYAKDLETGHEVGTPGEPGCPLTPLAPIESERHEKSRRSQRRR